MALYHWLDGFWSRFPWPDTLAVSQREVGPVCQIRLSRQYFGRRMMATHCYQVGDTLVDCGFPSAEPFLLQLAADRALKRLVLTHHHEDHSGNTVALAAAGLEVSVGELTAKLLAHDMPLPLYQHVAWGRTRPIRLDPDPATRTRIGDFEAEVIAAPGHAVDHRVFYVPEQGWLFSGDVFIHERVKVFRRDEDFAATLDTLERLVKLDFETLFCGHRPVSVGGREALRKKLQWLRDVEGGTRELHKKGFGVKQIVERLQLEGSATFRRVSMGDASAHNMVRSILHGPTMRAEVVAALANGD